MYQNIALFPYKSNWLTINGNDYHYIDEGDKERQTIVLLHGNPTWSFYYRNLIRDLSKSFRVISPDHMGMGLSDKPQNYPYHLRTHIENLTRLVENLGLVNIHLVIHDWGGVIGMGYAVENSLNIARIVLLNTAAYYLPRIPISLQMLRIPVWGDLLIRSLNIFLHATLIWGVWDKKHLSPQIKAGYYLPYDNWKNRIGILRFIQDIPLESSHPSRKLLLDIDRKLRLLENHPLLILWGNKDPVFKPQYFLREWEKRFPSATSYNFNDAGHLLLEDTYDEVSLLILDFFSK